MPVPDLNHSAVEQMYGLTVRPMRHDDVPEVLVIERAGQPLPWTEKHFLDEIGKIDASKPVVAQLDQRVVAFLVAWFVVDEIYLNNIGVAVAERKKGIASALLGWLFELGKKQNCASVHLEVRESNHAAIALYRKHGFERIGSRRRYYSDSGEDAILMHYLFASAGHS